MKKVIIIGATGFGGLGLIQILLRHPEFEITQITARKDIGKKISDIFPQLTGYCDLLIQENKDIDFTNTDLAFFSTPDQAGMNLIDQFYKEEIRVIDYSGDFRFNNLPDYEIYAKNKGLPTTHAATQLLAKSVYGIPELNKDLIKKAAIVGNPGCFATSMNLALLPLAKKNLLASDVIICDGKSGVSGAGKTPGEANYLPQRLENVNTYREGHHQHTVEVENLFNKYAEKKAKILFIPQVVPMSRGILTTIYADPIPGLTTDKLLAIYQDFYKDAPFVEITSKSVNSIYVRGTNKCLIRPMIDEHTGKIFITSAIDNLLKGQSGQAVQNANIMFDFDEKLALDVPTFYP